MLAQTIFALALTLLSAVAINSGYLIEHSAASELPPLSVRRPLRTVRLLLASRRWLTGFVLETCGFILALVALALAPLAARRAPAEVALAVGVFATTLATYAAWWTWWGGYAWGPRFLLPGLALLPLTVPLTWPALGRPARAAVWAIAALSTLAQLPGVLVDFNPFERALRARWPTFPLEGPLFGPESAQIAAHLLRLRREGAAALDLAWVAAGRVEGFWEFNLNPWDVAAGMLLVREAGGFVTDFRGGGRAMKRSEFLAANDALHSRLHKLVAGALR